MRYGYRRNRYYEALEKASLDDDLFLAVFDSDLNTIIELLEAGADINAKGEYGYTALMYASILGHIETVKLLLKAGADPNAKDENGYTALISVAENAKKFGYRHIPNEYGELTLKWVPVKDHRLIDYTEIVKLLLEFGADPNAENRFGYTALMFAVERDNKEVVKLLLEAGADPNVEEFYGNTALDLAYKFDNKKMVKLLKQNGAVDLNKSME